MNKREGWSYGRKFRDSDYIGAEKYKRELILRHAKVLGLHENRTTRGVTAMHDETLGVWNDVCSVESSEAAEQISGLFRELHTLAEKAWRQFSAAVFPTQKLVIAERHIAAMQKNLQAVYDLTIEFAYNTGALDVVKSVQDEEGDNDVEGSD